MKIFPNILLFLLAASLCVGAPKPKRQILSNGVTLLYSKTGAMLVDNRSGHFFTLRIEGKSIKTGKPGTTDTRETFLEVDGLPFQIMVVPASELMARKKKMDPKVLLAKHKETELRALREGQPDLKENVLLQKNSLLNGRPTLLWGFDFPEGVSEAKGQIYLTTPVHKALLTLTGVVQKEADRGAVGAFLTKTLGTLKLNKGAFDLVALQKQLKPPRRMPASMPKGQTKSPLENPPKR